MQLSELQNQIVTGKVDKLLMLFGEEVAIMDIYLKKIYSTLGIDIVKPDTVSEAYSKTMQKRLTGSAKCFIVRDDKEFFKNDKSWDTVVSQISAGTDYFIIIYSSMDKRSKFYKRFTDNLIEFGKLSPELLSKYIDKEIPNVSESLRIKLADICECSYSRILLECDKVKAIVAALPEYTNQSALMYLLQEGVIFQPIGDITFKLTDAILTRNVKDTLMYLEQARRKQEPEIMVLSILYNGFKHILMVQGLGADQREPSKRTGLTPWQVKLAKEKQGHYTLAELLNAMRIVRDTEKGIKTGQIDSDVSLESLVIGVFYNYQ